MRRAAAAVAALLASGSAAALAAPPSPIGPPTVGGGTGGSGSTAPATIAVSPATPAEPATVKLTVRHAFQCGRPRPATIALTFPAAERVPRSISTRAVRLSSGLVKHVGVSGKTVSVAVAAAPHKGVTCMSMFVGRLTLTFGAAAKLGNPASAGTYAVAVRDGRARYTTSFRVSS